MRSAAYVVGLAFRRLRRREGGALGAALGIAAAAAVLAGILVGATVAKDRSVAQDVERLPAASRSVRASWFGVPAGRDESWRVLDRQARAALAPLPADAPVSIVLVREATLGGAFVGLAAVDGLAPNVLLRSGRLPRACTPERCEVLRLRGVGKLPDVPGLRVVQVGTATLRSRQLFGDFLAPTDNALADAELAPALSRSDRYHRPGSGTARGRRGRLRARLVSCACPRVPQLQLGTAPVGRHAAALGDRPARGGRRPGAGGAPGALSRVVAVPSDAGTPCRRARCNGLRQTAAAGRGRGRGAARRLRRPRGGRAPARPRFRPQAPHLARRAALAARPAHRDGEHCDRPRRRGRRLGDRLGGGSRRGERCRRTRRRRALAERPLAGRSPARARRRGARRARDRGDRLLGVRPRSRIGPLEIAAGRRRRRRARDPRERLGRRG